MCVDELFDKYLFYIVFVLFIIFIIHQKTNLLNPDNLKNYYDMIIKNEYVFIFYIFLVIFIIFIPKINNKYNIIFDNIIYDLMMLSLIIYFSDKDKNITISILLSILYINQKNSLNDKTKFIIDDSNKNIDTTNNLLCGLNKRLINLETNNNYYDVNVNKSYNMSNNDISFELNKKNKLNVNNKNKINYENKIDKIYKSIYDYGLLNNKSNNQLNNQSNNQLNNKIK